MGRNTGRGKVAYSWISPDPAKTGPTLGVVVVVVVIKVLLALQYVTIVTLESAQRYARGDPVLLLTFHS